MAAVIIDGPQVRPSGHSASAVPKKMHLTQAAPFGRLDQMLRTTICTERKAFDQGGPAPLARLNQMARTVVQGRVW